MNFGTVISALVPYLLQLLADPRFQTVLSGIFANFQQKIAAGVSPAVASDHAAGAVTAAAALHLSGNPIADVQAFLANFKSPAAATGAPFP